MEWLGSIRPNTSIPLFFNKRKKVLENYGIKNIEFFPAKIIADDKTTEYRAANILGLIEAMD
jgi:hypothetical protein